MAAMCVRLDWIWIDWFYFKCIFLAIKVNLGHFDLFCSNLFHIQDHLQRDPARVLQAEGAEEAEQGLGLGVGVGGPLPRPRGEAPQKLLPQVGLGGRAPNDGSGSFHNHGGGLY